MQRMYNQTFSIDRRMREFTLRVNFDYFGKMSQESYRRGANALHKC